MAVEPDAIRLLYAVEEVAEAGAIRTTDLMRAHAFSLDYLGLWGDGRL
jgi:hypothetical protein